MRELNRQEFRRVFRDVVAHRHLFCVDSVSTKMSPDNSRINYKQLQAIISCAGKNVIGQSVESMWPAKDETISFDQAYSIFIRYDPPTVTEDLSADDISKLKKCTLHDIIENVRSKNPLLEEKAVELLNEFRCADGSIDIQKFLLDVDEIQKRVKNICEKQTDREISDDVEIQKEEDADARVELSGFCVVSPELMFIQHTIDFQPIENCELVLKLGKNSDMRFLKDRHPFENDVFALVIDNEKQMVAITHRVTREGYSTGMFQGGSGYRVIVVCLGTSPWVKSNGSKSVELTDGHQKLTKHLKMVLMNVFDMFDLDNDGLLSKSEYDVYATASGDRETTEEDWESLSEQFQFRDNCLTLGGFLDLHQCELEVDDSRSIDDLWTSLVSIGYDNQLKMVNACPFVLETSTSMFQRAEVCLRKMTRDDSQLILSYLYEIAEPNDHCELYSRTFRAEYFGITIVDRHQAPKDHSYAIRIVEEENVKWNFVNGKENIRPSSYEAEWIFILAYSTTSTTYKAEFELINEQDV